MKATTRLTNFSSADEFAAIVGVWKSWWPPSCVVCRFQGQVISKLGGFKVERSCGNFGVRNKNKNKKFIFDPKKITNNETIEICINTNKIYAHI